MGAHFQESVDLARFLKIRFLRMGRFQVHKIGFSLEIRNGPISDFKNPGFRSQKTWPKGGIHCISQVFPGHFYFMREHSLVELTEHDDSAANIIVQVCIHICTAAFIVHVPIMNGRRSGTREISRKQALSSAWSMEMSKLTRDGTAEPV